MTAASNELKVKSHCRLLGIVREVSGCTYELQSNGHEFAVLALRFLSFLQ